LFIDEVIKGGLKMNGLPEVKNDKTLENSFLGETTQVCVVTRDYRKVMKNMVIAGIGPCCVYTFGPDNVTDLTYRGEPGSCSWRLCLASSGTMMWEIIQPLSGPNIYEDFLEKHGEGIHHVAINCNNIDWGVRIAEFEKHGFKMVQSGRWEGKVPFAYFATEDDPVTTFETFIFPEGFEMPAPEEWYPAPPPES
jgi:hypothetical protein